MEPEWKKSIYLYGDDYAAFLRTFIDNLKSSGKVLENSDFSQINCLHPSGFDGINLFLERFEFPINSKILDIGCGIGGTSQYLGIKGFKVHGIDILPHFIKIAEEITELTRLSTNIDYQCASILDESLILPDKYNLALLIGVALIAVDSQLFKNVYNHLDVDGMLYIEDYYLIKEREDLTQEELDILLGYHYVLFRTKSTFIRELTEAGFEIQELEEFSDRWSEFAWNRSEKILKIHEETGAASKEELILYGINSPKILCHLNKYSEEEILAKFPYTCKHIGTKYPMDENKIVGVLRIAAFKR